MTYEEYLDEVTTLLTEQYGLSDAAAIKLVMRAQSAGYFIEHDDVAAMRTLERTRQDAKIIFGKFPPPPAKPSSAPSKTKGPRSKRPR